MKEEETEAETEHEHETVQEAPDPLVRWAPVLDCLDTRKIVAHLLELWFINDEDPHVFDVDKPVNGGDAVDVVTEQLGELAFALAREMAAK